MDVPSSCRGLVISLASRMCPDPALVDEAVQVGLLGLLEAQNRHDPARGPIETFAYRWIRGAIRRWLTKELCARSHLSMDAPLADVEGAEDLHDVVADPTVADPVDVLTCRRLGEMLEELTPADMRALARAIAAHGEKSSVVSREAERRALKRAITKLRAVAA